jgi:V8-like Glu-specific endopeptidase
MEVNMTVGYPDSSQYPYSAVSKIVCTWSDGSTSSGSGVFVGPNDILTAAHVVDEDTKNLIDIDIYAGYSAGPGTVSFTTGTWQADYYILDHADNTYTDAETSWDVAVIGISENLGNQTGWLGMQSWAPASSNNHILGYPAEWGYDSLVETYPYFGSATLSDAGNYEVYGYEVGPGMSGGPVVNGDGYVVGVQSTTYAANCLNDEWDTLMTWMTGNDDLVPVQPAWTVADLLKEYTPSLDLSVASLDF